MGVRTVLRQGDSGWAITQTIKDDETGDVVDLTGLTSVRFVLRLEYEDTNVIDDASATIFGAPTNGQVRWQVAVPDAAPLGIALGYWVFNNGEQISAGEFTIEPKVSTGDGNSGATLATWALTVPALVRERVRLPGDDTKSQQALIRIINAASREMIDFADREFAPLATNPSVRKVWVPSHGRARIPDCQALASASYVNPDGTTGTALTAPTVTDAGYWALGGWWRLSNTFTYLELGADPVYGADSFTGGLIALTGTWGWPTVPDHIRYLATMTAREWYDDERIRTQAWEEDAGPSPEFNNIALPSAVRAALHRYRVISLG